MAAQRRDGDRDTADSAARIWQVYADHIGLPDARPADGTGPLPASQAHEPFPVPPPTLTASRPRALRLRTIAVAVVNVVSIVVLVLVAAVAGTALWSYSRTAAVVPEPPVPAAAPVPMPIVAADSVKTAERSAAPAAAQPPRAPDAPVNPPISHASSSGAVSRPDDAAASRARSAVPVKAERTTFGETVTFDFGSDRLGGESLRALDKVVLAMKANPEWRLAIEGHTDSHGAPEYNQELSERRAEVVKMHLETAGIAPHRLRALGFGATRPIVPNDGRRDFLNRRVEFRRR